MSFVVLLFIVSLIIPILLSTHLLLLLLFRFQWVFFHWNIFHSLTLSSSLDITNCNILETNSLSSLECIHRVDWILKIAKGEKILNRARKKEDKRLNFFPLFLFQHSSAESRISHNPLRGHFYGLHYILAWFLGNT